MVPSGPRRWEVSNRFRGIHDLGWGLQGQGQAQSGEGPPWQEEDGTEVGGGRWTSAETEKNGEDGGEAGWDDATEEPSLTVAALSGSPPED